MYVFETEVMVKIRVIWMRPRQRCGNKGFTVTGCRQGGTGMMSFLSDFNPFLSINKFAKVSHPEHSPLKSILT